MPKRQTFMFMQMCTKSSDFPSVALREGVNYARRYSLQQELS